MGLPQSSTRPHPAPPSASWLGRRRNLGTRQKGYLQQQRHAIITHNQKHQPSLELNSRFFAHRSRASYALPTTQATFTHPRIRTHVRTHIHTVRPSIERRHQETIRHMLFEGTV